MTVSILAVTALLSASQATPPAVPAASPTPTLSARFDVDAQQRRRQQQEEQQTLRPGERPHTVGVGGQLAVSNRGAGAGARFFFGERLGVNLNAFWYNGNSRYPTATSGQGSSYGTFPSFIVMLTKPDPTRDVDVRPYVGGGISYVSTPNRVTTNGTTRYERIGGTGGQAFGGVEMTFKEAKWMTISAEGIYYRLPVRFVNTSIMDGFNYLLAFHFYLK